MKSRLIVALLFCSAMMRMMKVVGHPDTRLMELDGYGHLMTAPAFPLLIREVRRVVKLKK